MGKSKDFIKIEDFNEWLSSTGYLFPSNSIELERFEIIFKDYQYQISSEVIDPVKILNSTYKKVLIEKEFKDDNSAAGEFRLAARNINKLPDHILKKIKNNENGSNKGTT